MSLNLGRQGGVAQPLRKRTVGQTNIAHVYDGANYIWPTSVIHFSDFTSVQNSELFGVYIDGRNHYCKTVKRNYLRIVPFFIYLNFSMDKFIDVIVDGILSNFDFGFMFIVNVLTYIIIKVIDYFNGDNKVPTWQKRCILIISIFTMAMIYIASGYDNTIMLVNSAILAPVFWSWVVSPILKKFGVGYKDIDNTIG